MCFDAEEGWGVIEAPEVPCGCLVHFAGIQVTGYRELQAGQRVQFTFGRPGALQDGWAYRALRSGQTADGDAQAPIAVSPQVRPDRPALR
jgi:cold shock CspA family protein